MNLSDLQVHDIFFFEEGQKARYQQKGGGGYTLVELKVNPLTEYIVLRVSDVVVKVRPVHSHSVEYEFRISGTVNSASKKAMEKNPQKYLGLDCKINILKGSS